MMIQSMGGQKWGLSRDRDGAGTETEISICAISGYAKDANAPIIEISTSEDSSEIRKCIKARGVNKR